MKRNIELLVEEKDIGVLGKGDIETISNIIFETFTSKSVDVYLDILNEYIIKKKSLKLNSASVAEKCDLPEATLKRFENLQTIPKALTLIKALNAVNLKLIAVPIDDDITVGAG